MVIRRASTTLATLPMSCAFLVRERVRPCGGSPYLSTVSAHADLDHAVADACKLAARRGTECVVEHVNGTEVFVARPTACPDPLPEGYSAVAAQCVCCDAMGWQVTAPDGRSVWFEDVDSAIVDLRNGEG